ncbi:hypothetical protein SUDANB176_06011 [Streptomyces sp. enrichment culture]
MSRAPDVPGVLNVPGVPDVPTGNVLAGRGGPADRPLGVSRPAPP